jgi:hypothetical protein
MIISTWKHKWYLIVCDYNSNNHNKNNKSTESIVIVIYLIYNIISGNDSSEYLKPLTVVMIH